MRVFITSHSSRRGGGVSVARNLIAALGRTSPQHEFFVTVPPGLGFEELCQAMPRCGYRVFRHRGLAGRWCWETFCLPSIARRFKPDVIFNLGNRGFISPCAPQATLIQDAHLFYPFSHFGKIPLKHRLMFWYHRRHLRNSMRSTGLLFCQTEVARDRLHATYGRGLRIAVCPNQLSRDARQSAAGAEAPDNLRPYRGKFTLFVPTRYYAHKNLEIIPEVFQRHRRELRDVVVVFTLSAEEAPEAGTLLESIRLKGLDSNLVTVGPLRQDELAAYYAHTDATLLPTLLESFSGTYLEAMSYGRPILTSGLDFARTVCGDAAEYFAPRDPESVCRAILRLKDDPTRRTQLAEAGKQSPTARSPSWDEIGRRVMGGLESLAAEPGRGRNRLPLWEDLKECSRTEPC